MNGMNACVWVLIDEVLLLSTEGVHFSLVVTSHSSQTAQVYGPLLRHCTALHSFILGHNTGCTSINLKLYLELDQLDITEIHPVTYFQ